MTARNLREAIEIQNAVEYGLTAGLQSLDRAEIREWRDKVIAGNLYVNRTTTGAIVERQPFGGWKRSSVGWGLKAGGLNYLFGFGCFEDGAAHLNNEEWLEQARLSDERWMRERFGFGVEADRGNLKCESNIKSYHATSVVVLTGSDVSTDDRRVLRIAQFAQRAKQIGNVKLDITFVRADSKLPKQLQQPKSGLRVVTIGDVGDAVDKLRSNPDVTIFENHVFADGLITGLMLLRERATSITTHRFGNTFAID
jgi:RHH-type proline utilization regulon transcriptional repressor/proline dehydrogenase/delta 1-pyrroline-5-carboxylate dehydrogenase